MKKIITLLTVFIFFSQFCFGYQFTFGNDLLGMNLFSPIENARTFNFYTVTPLLYGVDLELDYSLFVNEESIKRADEASIILTYPIEFPEILKFTPSIGLTITGDLSGDNINDVLDKEMTQYFYSSLLFSREKSLLQSIINSGRLYTDIFSEIKIITNYTVSAALGSSLAFSAVNFNLKLGYSYGYRYNFVDFETLNYEKGLENEGKIDFTILAGDFRYDLNLLLDGSFSTGKYSINLNLLPEKSELSKIDIKVIPGTEYDLGSDNFMNSLQMELVPLNWEFSRIDFHLKSIYGWNKPDVKNLSNDSIYVNETYYTRLALGANINLLENYDPYWINPFVGIGIGFENFHYYKEYDTNETYLIPIYELRTGFNILLPQFLIKDNIQYGLNFSVVYRGSLDGTEFKNNILLTSGILIALEL